MNKAERQWDNVVDIKVNGVVLHYAVRGAGAPIILLHGNGESHKIFAEVAGELGKSFTVYALDNRGHGGSSRVKALHYADMCDDVIAFIEELKLNKPILYGFSDGGIIGLMVAIKRSELLKKLIVSGANISPDGMSEGFLSLVRLMCRLGGGAKWRLMRDEPSITATELGQIAVPTVVLAGEKDIVKEEHTRALAAAIDGSFLSIFPGEGHGSYVLNAKKLINVLFETAKILN